MTYGRNSEPAPNASSNDSSSGMGGFTKGGSPLLRYLLVFGVGALIGLVLFGWILFPVRWTQTLPSDLRGDAQEDYLRLVADSYAGSGDLPAAIQRLEYWSPQQSTEMYNRLADKFTAAGDTATAERLRAVAEDTNLIRTNKATLPPPTGTVTPSPNSGQYTRRASNLNLFLYLFAALIILALLIVIARSLRVPLLQGRLGRSQPGPAQAPPPAKRQAQPPASAPRSPSAQAPDRYTAAPPPSAAVRDAGPAPSVSKPGTSPGAPTSRPSQPAPAPDRGTAPPPPPARPAPPAPAPFLAPSSAGGARGLSAAEVFRFTGDPNYNEVREIAQHNEYLGEYGMGAGYGGQDNPDATYTMEVWLFDKSDIRTVTAVLLPPEVYNDAELRTQAAGSATPVLLANGAAIQLQTNQLIVEGRIRRVAFGRTDSEGTPISQLEVEMTGRTR